MKGVTTLLCIIVSALIAGLIATIFVLQGTTNEVTQLKAQVASQAARLQGGHRDLVTCGDLQKLITNGYVSSYWSDANYNLQSTPANLPMHCINP